MEKNRKHNYIREDGYAVKMKNPENCVEFDDVHTYFFTDIGTVKAVSGISFDVPQGKTVGIVGESGCGKSVTGLSLMRLLQRYGKTVKGEIRFNAGDKAYNVVNTPESVMRKLRGNDMSMIFQDSMTSLNPVLRVGKQMDEVIALHNLKMTGEEVKERSRELLGMVGIAEKDVVYNMYPHELSGGMHQRIMTAMAIACSPKLIIADEPTTALDVTIQAQILDLLCSLKDKINSSIMLITHDLAVAEKMADYVVVMYAGRIVEKGTAGDIFMTPKHPYTIGLMRSRPVSGKKADKLYSIPGSVPNPVDMPDCCYFRERCEMCVKGCEGKYPGVCKISDTHEVSCYRMENEEKIYESQGEFCHGI